MDRRDPLHQFRIRNRAGRRATLLPRIEPAARHAKGPAHGGDGEHGLVRRHELEEPDDVTSF